MAATCPNAPAQLDVRYIGKCHMCGESDHSIGFCTLCCHWFCRRCSRRWVRRTLAAIKEKWYGRVPNCCGPEVLGNGR